MCCCSTPWRCSLLPMARVRPVPPLCRFPALRGAAASTVALPLTATQPFAFSGAAAAAASTASSAAAVYVADSYNHRLKELDPSSNTIRTLAGSGAAGYRDGDGHVAQLSEPGGLALGPEGEACPCRACTVWLLAAGMLGPVLRCTSGSHSALQLSCRLPPSLLPCSLG